MSTTDPATTDTALGPRQVTMRSGRPIAFRVTHGGPGLPVVLHHGIFSTADHWSDLGYVERIVADRSVIAVDGLAHGGSARPADDGAYGLARRTADTVAVLDELGLARAHVWGYSLGGWVACGMARHAPDRVGALVVAGWDPVRGLATAYEAFAALFELSVDDTDWYAGLVASGRSHPTTAAELDRGDEAAFRACHRACELDADLADSLTDFTGPLLLACGADDPYHPNMAALADRADAPMVTLPGDHGRAWIHGAPATDEILSFLRVCDTGGR